MIDQLTNLRLKIEQLEAEAEVRRLATLSEHSKVIALRFVLEKLAELAKPEARTHPICNKIYTIVAGLT